MLKPLPTIPVLTAEWSHKNIGYVKVQSWTLGQQQPMLFKKDEQRPIGEIMSLILGECVVEAKDSRGTPLSIDEMPLVLAEMAFIKTREISVSDTQEYIVKCSNCGNEKLHVEADLKTVEITNDKVEAIVIGGYHIYIKLPTLNLLDMDPEAITPENLEFIADNIEMICTADDTWLMSDYSLPQRVAFVSSLPMAFPLAFVKRYAKLPQIATELRGTCPDCNNEYNEKVQGVGGLFMG